MATRNITRMSDVCTLKTPLTTLASCYPLWIRPDVSLEASSLLPRLLRYGRMDSSIKFHVRLHAMQVRKCFILLLDRLGTKKEDKGPMWCSDRSCIGITRQLFAAILFPQVPVTRPSSMGIA